MNLIYLFQLISNLPAVRVELGRTYDSGEAIFEATAEGSPNVVALLHE